MTWLKYKWRDRLPYKVWYFLFGNLRVSWELRWPVGEIDWEWDELIPLDQPEPDWSKIARVKAGLKQEGAWNE